MFTFAYGTAAARLRRAEKVLTSQAWNMTFSFYHSLKSQPVELDEAARMYRLTKWERFWKLDVPSSMIGLVWNMMMSMGGGWFFLTASEDYTVLGSRLRAWVDRWRVYQVGEQHGARRYRRAQDEGGYGEQTRPGPARRCRLGGRKPHTREIPLRLKATKRGLCQTDSGACGPGVGGRKGPPDEHRPEDKDREQAMARQPGRKPPQVPMSAGVDGHDGGGQAHERGNAGHLEHTYFLVSNGPAQHQNASPLNQWPGRPTG